MRGGGPSWWLCGLQQDSLLPGPWPPQLDREAGWGWAGVGDPTPDPLILFPLLLLSFVKVTDDLLMAGNSLMGGPPASIPWEGAKQPWAFVDGLPLLLCHQGG